MCGALNAGCGVWIVHRSELCASCEYGQRQGPAPWMGSGLDLGHGHRVWHVRHGRVTADSALPRSEHAGPHRGGGRAWAPQPAWRRCPWLPRQRWTPAPRHTAGPQPSPQLASSCCGGGQRGALGPDLAPPCPGPAPALAQSVPCHGSWVRLDPGTCPLPGPLCPGTGCRDDRLLCPYGDSAAEVKGHCPCLPGSVCPLPK